MENPAGSQLDGVTVSQHVTLYAVNQVCYMCAGVLMYYIVCSGTGQYKHPWRLVNAVYVCSSVYVCRCTMCVGTPCMCRKS